MILPDEDRYLASRTKFEAELVTMLGGRAAEEVVFDRVTTGASNDLERATELARKMVMEYGMSDELGPMTYGEREEMVFLGRSIAEHRNYSETVARKIDAEVRGFIAKAHDRAAGDVMTVHRDYPGQTGSAVDGKRDPERGRSGCLDCECHGLTATSRARPLPGQASTAYLALRCNELPVQLSDFSPIRMQGPAKQAPCILFDG